MIMIPLPLSLEEKQAKALWVRQQVLEMAAAAGEGHVTSAFSCIDALTELYYGGHIRYSPPNPKWDARDRLVMSKGHGGIALYPILADLGYFPKDKLIGFCQEGSCLGVHAEWNTPGIECITGSLGHGFSVAVGMALAAKLDGKQHRVYCLLGDGECYEGQVWEAAMLAAHHELANLIVLLDRNGLCCSAKTEDIVRQDSMKEKWEAFGWTVLQANGHQFYSLRGALEAAKRHEEHSSSPVVIIMNTVKGKGVPFLENVVLWHGRAVLGEELEKARGELR